MKEVLDSIERQDAGAPTAKCNMRAAKGGHYSFDLNYRSQRYVSSLIPLRKNN